MRAANARHTRNSQIKQLVFLKRISGGLSGELSKGLVVVLFFTLENFWVIWVLFLQTLLRENNLVYLLNGSQVKSCLAQSAVISTSYDNLSLENLTALQLYLL